MGLMKRLACAGAAAVAMAGTAFAAPITFTFTSISADLDLAGTTTADLVITLSGDTDNYLPTPLGPFGTNRYLNLSAKVSSTSLGLSDVALTNTLDLLIGGASFPDLVGLSSGNGVVGLGSHPNTVGDLIANWDRVSNFSASQMQSLTDNGFFTLNFANGAPSVQVFRLDGNSGPTPQDGGFSATLVTTPSTVPEPSAPALVLMALAASALVSRRRVR